MLDKKLSEIILYPDTYYEDFKLSETDIARIKQAFADEGYVEHGIKIKPRKRYFATGPGQIPPLEEPQQPCMTGQEWLDRFIKELDSGLKLPEVMDIWVRHCAKKASGVDK